MVTQVLYIKRGAEEKHSVRIPREYAILAAAYFKAHYALSYTDAFVVAAAQEWDAGTLPDAPEFQAVQGIIEVEWLAHDPGVKISVLIT
jgi:hypothetical protein